MPVHLHQFLEFVLASAISRVDVKDTCALQRTEASLSFQKLLSALRNKNVDIESAAVNLAFSSQGSLCQNRYNLASHLEEVVST